jgi:SOS response regulatory protein OraA/RecX
VAEPPTPPPFADPVEHGKAIALRLLAAHGWSVAALKTRLLKRGVPREAAERVVSDFERAGLLGDRAFAEETARLELSRRPASDAFLEARIQGKGVPETIASRATRNAVEGVSELTRAKDLARRSVRPGKDPAATRRKLLGVLMRRGFDFETASAAADHALGPAPEPQDHTGDDLETQHERL